MKKLILIDSNALVHRAFHALPPSLTSPKGIVTNAVYGFTSVLLKMLKDLKPDYIAATFDMAGPTFRHEEFSEYKATRTKAPDELYAQIPLVKSLLAAFGIPVFELQGYEADDVIGSLAEQAKQIADLETIIVTGDMDTLQLVDSPCVSVFTLRKGVTDTVIYDEKEVKKRYGISPAQIADFKGLKGDPSDNIPGVKGIGEKTASMLIQKFGSLENLYEKLERDKKKLGIPEKLSAKLIESKDMALFSKKLATIIRNVPVAFTIEDVDWHTRFDGAALDNIMREFGFFSLLKRIPEALGTPPIQNTESNAQTISMHPKTKPNDLPIDREIALILTDGSISISGDTKNVYIANIPASDRSLFDKTPLVIGHDIKQILKRIHIDTSLFDTKIAAWLLNPDARQYELERLSQQYFNRAISNELALQAPLILELKRILSNELGTHKLLGIFHDIEMPLIPILSDMEKRGITVDLPAIKKLSSATQKTLAKLEKKIYSYSDGIFNINSPAQLSEVLFKKLGITGKIKKTSGGALSTAAAELEKIRDEHPIIKLIIEYRELQKLQTTYIEPFPSLVGPDGRIHTTYNQTGTGTGRLSSQDPNLQNIPTRTQLGQEFRRAFVADNGYMLLSFDYSQLELRIAACLANDKTMIEAFHRGEDIHTRTAAEIFHVQPDHVTKEMRRTAKVLNFGVIYGMGSIGFAQAADIDRAHAKEFIKQYLDEFSGIASYMVRMKDEAYRDGFVETLFGRRRLLPDMHSTIPQMRAQAERMAINHPVQGTGADLIKLAMIRIASYLKNNGLENDIRMLLQVHDELVFEVRKSHITQAVTDISNIMETVHNMAVPLLVDAKTGKNWTDMEPINTK